MKVGQKYRDRYGQLWTLKIYMGKWAVYNSVCKWGLWDNGKGLTKLTD